MQTNAIGCSASLYSKTSSPVLVSPVLGKQPWTLHPPCLARNQGAPANATERNAKSRREPCPRCPDTGSGAGWHLDCLPYRLLYLDRRTSVHSILSCWDLRPRGLIDHTSHGKYIVSFPWLVGLTLTDVVGGFQSLSIGVSVTTVLRKPAIWH